MGRGGRYTESAPSLVWSTDTHQPYQGATSLSGRAAGGGGGVVATGGGGGWYGGRVEGVPTGSDGNSQLSIRKVGNHCFSPPIHVAAAACDLLSCSDPDPARCSGRGGN